MKVDILGTEYSIAVKKYGDEEAFKQRGIDGYCDGYAKEIVLCDPLTREGWEKEPEKTIVPYRATCLRHEIVHALMFESGLAQNSNQVDGWAQNEEMIDWIARQGPEIYAAWQEAGAL